MLLHYHNTKQQMSEQQMEMMSNFELTSHRISSSEIMPRSAGGRSTYVVLRRNEVMPWVMMISDKPFSPQICSFAVRVWVKIMFTGDMTIDMA
jgi:hypothetical protein